MSVQAEQQLKQDFIPSVFSLQSVWLWIWIYATFQYASFMKVKYGAVPPEFWGGGKSWNITEQKSHERHKLALCVHIKTVLWQGREMRAEWLFRGRSLAQGALYEELLCQKTKHVPCVFPNPAQFHLKLLFFQTCYFYWKYWSSYIVESTRYVYRDGKRAYCNFLQI